LEDAGRFFLPRLVAVVMVLTVAAISIGQLVSSLVANLKNIDLQVYRQGLTELEQAILALAQKVSRDIKDQLQLESVVMGKSATLAGAEGCNGATTEETHPVLILFAVIICGEVWGTTGMLISVPLISMVRLVLNLERSLDKRTAEIRRSNTINIPEGDLAASSDVAELEAEQEMLQGCRR